jgi:hypothetical protein
MRGMGGIFKRGPVWWIRYGHRGRKYPESSSRPGNYFDEAKKLTENRTFLYTWNGNLIQQVL